jgi:predicted lipoprotein with Yx(FWY)xxD motif
MFGRRSTLAFLAVTALAIGACTASTTGGTPQPSTQAPTPVATVEPSPTASAEESAEPTSSGGSSSEDYPLKAVTGAAVGPFLTGENDLTLYTFKPDVKDSGKSTCNGDCATNWPPYVLESDEKIEAGDGVGGTTTMITRDDGTTQVAYNGMPLYYFAGDTKAGDTNGQGLADKWFVAAP